MTGIIRQLTSDTDLGEFARISLGAYPAFSRPEEESIRRYHELVEKDHASEFWGLFDNGRLRGGMRLLDFQMNYFGDFIPAGGVGGVAVDLLYKKRGAARDLIRFFLDDCEQKGQYIAMLYPFRPDFYHQMGFGYGPKMNLFSFTPTSLPKGPREHGVEFLCQDDLPELEEFCGKLAADRHGYCRKSAMELENLWKAHGEKRTLVGFRDGGQLRGYMAFSFKRAHDNNFVKNNLIIHEWQWYGSEALAAFCSFIHTQADQIHRVIFFTQIGDFHFLLSDVRNGTDNIIPSVYHESNTAGVGLMYRIVSLPKFFESIHHRNFGGATARIRLRVTDTLRPQNAGTYALTFNDGIISLDTSSQGNGTAFSDVSVDISELSALLMGSVSVSALNRLGRLDAPAETLSVLETAFRTPQAPECITPF